MTDGTRRLRRRHGFADAQSSKGSKSRRPAGGVVRLLGRFSSRTPRTTGGWSSPREHHALSERRSHQRWRRRKVRQLRFGVNQHVARHSHVLETAPREIRAIRESACRPANDDQEIGIAAGRGVASGKRAEQPDLDDDVVLGQEASSRRAEARHDTVSIEREDAHMLTAVAFLHTTQESSPHPPPRARPPDACNSQPERRRAVRSVPGRDVDLVERTTTIEHRLVDGLGVRLQALEQLRDRVSPRVLSA